MSAFLGPIHYWLFNKIKFHEELEENLTNAFKNKYGNEINEIITRSIELYGNPLRFKPLEEQIDLSNIHQWLNTTIGKTETRLAFILAEVFRKHGLEAIEIASKEYIAQGKQCGNDAKEKGMAENASKIYNALNDYLLEGMPCDRVNFITESTEEILEWKTTDCLHRNYWKSVGAELSTLYKLRYAWIEAFVEGANPKFKLIYQTGNNIDSLFINKIAKKSSV